MTTDTPLCINCRYCVIPPKSSYLKPESCGCNHPHIAVVNLVTGELEPIRCTIVRGMEETDHHHAKCMKHGVYFEAK